MSSDDRARTASTVAAPGDGLSAPGPVEGERRASADSPQQRSGTSDSLTGGERNRHANGNGHTADGTGDEREPPTPGNVRIRSDGETETILTTFQINEMYKKIQLKLVPFLMFLYFLAFLDRANVGNAHDDLTNDLDMTESQYTNAAAIFFLGYTVAEVPANLAMTKVQPAIWIGALMMVWGAFAAAMAAVKNYTSLLIIRTFLGLFEGGFFPGAVFYLTTWFPPERIAWPVAVFHSASAIAGCIGGLLAYGILQMEGIRGMHGWQWLFLLEGLPTVLVGAAVYWVLPARPEDCNWLDDNEREYIRNHLKRHAGDVHSYNLSWIEVRDTLFSPRVLFLAFLNFFMLIPVYSTAFYMPSLLKNFGYTTLQANLLTSPVYALAIAASLLNSWHSDKTKERYLHVLVPCFLTAGFYIAQIFAIYYQIHAAEFTFLFFTTAFTWASVGPFFGWLSGTLKSRTASAVGIAWVGAIAHPAAYLGPAMYAWGKESKYASYWPAMIGMSGAMIISGGMIIGWMFSAWNEPVGIVQRHAAAEHERNSDRAPTGAEEHDSLIKRSNNTSETDPDHSHRV